MSTTDTKTTVSQVANVIVPVDDQDAMLAFYTDTLGLEKRADVPFGDEAGYRWIEVAPDGAADADRALPPGPELGRRRQGHRHRAPGRRRRLLPRASCARAASTSTTRSAGIGDPVPPMFWFRDPEGNSLMVVEVR